MEKYDTAGQATDVNIIRRMRCGCRQEYRHTLRICSACCFSLQETLLERASVLRYSTLTVFYFIILFVIVFDVRVTVHRDKFL